MAKQLVYPKTKSGQDRIERFLLALIGECKGNQSAAARAVGIPERSAGTWSCDTLTIPEVRQRLKELRDEKCDELNITADRILAEYQAIAFANIMHYTKDGVNGKVIDLDELTRAQGAAIQEITIDEYEEHDPDGEDEDATRTVKKTKIKLHPKLPALEQLAKYRGIAGIGTNKIELSNPDGTLKPSAGPIAIGVVFVDAEDGRPIESGNSPKLLEGSRD